jgi:hypothetical protein
MGRSRQLASPQRPDRLELFREDPTRTVNAVEELLRFDGSNQRLQRVGLSGLEGLEDEFETRPDLVLRGLTGPQLSTGQSHKGGCDGIFRI